MAQDVLRLADQFFFGELADVDEIVVGIFDVAMEIGGRNNCFDSSSGNSTSVTGKFRRMVWSPRMRLN